MVKVVKAHQLSHVLTTTIFMLKVVLCNKLNFCKIFVVVTYLFILLKQKCNNILSDPAQKKENSSCGDAVFSSVASQPNGLDLLAGCGLSAWGLYVLAVPVWVVPGCSSFLPQPKYMHVRLSSNSKYVVVGVNMSMNNSQSRCVSPVGLATACCVTAGIGSSSAWSCNRVGM